MFCKYLNLGDKRLYSGVEWFCTFSVFVSLQLVGYDYYTLVFCNHGNLNNQQTNHIVISAYVILIPVLL